MTDAELRDQAVAALELTTVGYKNVHWKVPPVGSQWKKGLDLLAQIGVAPQPPSGDLASALPPELPPSTGAIYYVDPVSGDDSRSATQAQTQATAWKTINHAFPNVPLSGSIIEVVGNGVMIYSVPPYASYAINPNGIQGDPANPVTLRCQTKWGVTVESSGGPSGGTTIGGWIVGCTGIRVEGFKFNMRGGPVGPSYGFLVEDSHHIEISGNWMPEGGLGASRGGTVVCDSIQWLRNLVGNAGTDSTDPYYGFPDGRGTHLGYLGQDDDSTPRGANHLGTYLEVVASNIFYGDTPGYDLELGPQNDSAFVVNNTIYGNQGSSSRLSGDGIMLFDNGGTWKTRGATIKNNIFAKLKGSAVYWSTGGQVGNLVENNLSWALQGLDAAGDGFPAGTAYPQPSPAYTIGPRGNLPDADPRFANPATLDFSLLAGSPAIGVSEPAYTPLTDFNGKPRTGTPNLGAL